MTLTALLHANVRAKAPLLQAKPKKMIRKFPHAGPKHAVALQHAEQKQLLLAPSLPKDTMICNSVEDWLRPESDRYCGLHVPRHPTWAEAEVQQEIDEMASRQAFGDTGLLMEDVTLATCGGSEEQLKAELSSRGRRLLRRARGAGLPCRLCEAIGRDVEEMGAAMARMLPGSEKLVIGLEIVGENRCRRWHQDYLICRAIVSYAGCGTVYLDTGNVNWDVLRHRGLNEHIIKDSREVFSAEVGDVLLMKGCKFPGAAAGLVHKSPEMLFHSDGRRVNRLCLKIDVA